MPLGWAALAVTYFAWAGQLLAATKCKINGFRCGWQSWFRIPDMDLDLALTIAKTLLGVTF